MSEHCNLALFLERPASPHDNVSRFIMEVLFKGTARLAEGDYNKIKVYGLEEVRYLTFINANVKIVRFHGTIGIFADSSEIASRYLEFIIKHKVNFSLYKNVVSSYEHHLFPDAEFDGPFDRFIMVNTFCINMVSGIYAVYLTSDSYCIIDNSHYTVPIVYLEKIEDISDDLLQGLFTYGAVIKTQIPMNEEILEKYNFTVISGKKAFIKHPCFVNSLIYYTTHVTPSTPKLQVKSTNKQEKRKVEDD